MQNMLLLAKGDNNRRCSYMLLYATILNEIMLQKLSIRFDYNKFNVDLENIHP